MNRVLTILRDLVIQASELPDDQDSTPEEQAAFLTGLEELIARHSHAANVRKVNALTPTTRTRPIDPVLSARDDHWLVYNGTASTYHAVHDGTSTECPPGASFLTFDPSDSLVEPIGRGEIEVYPAGHHMPWADRLVAKLAWERRAMCASRIGDADELRACLDHVPPIMRPQIAARIEAIAKDKATQKNHQPPAVAQRFRGSNKAAAT